jgi:nucleoside-diphosphate-sugar epimerase
VEANGAVLVLGSTGIIGTNTVSACVRRGFDVLGVSRGTRRPNGESVPAGYEHARAEVRGPDALRAVVAGRTFDAVIDFTSFTDRDVARTLSTLQGRCAIPLRVVGDNLLRRRARPPDRRVSPQVSTGWSYALAKVRAEERVRSMCQDLGMDYTIARPYITYSSQRIPLSVWEPVEILGRLRDGWAIPVGPDILDATTTITSSADVANALALLVCNPSALGQDFIVASDQPTTWRAVLGAAADAVGGRVVESRCWAQALARAFPAIQGKIV